MTIVATPHAVPVSPNASASGGVTNLNHRGPRETGEAKAAREFEGMLLQQLLQVLRKTVPESGDEGGAGSAGGMYMQMFDESIAGAMADGGGIGLAQAMRGAFEGEEGDAAARSLSSVGGLSSVSGSSPHATTFRSLAGMMPALSHALAPTHGERLGGGVGALQQVAQHMLAGDQGSRWAKTESLTAQELSSSLATEAPGGVARFNVRDANGYQGYNKCNLFAFEMARRAGYAVPVVARLHGWGFPNSNSVTEDASDDRSLRGDWGRVVTGATAPDLDRAITGQGRAFMLSGSASEAGRSGHMAVIERIHDVKYGKDGEIRSVDFDGWEARPDGADHLVRRRWNRFGEGSNEVADRGARNGLQDIEIIELMRPNGGATPEVTLSQAHAASVNDQVPQDPPATARNLGWRQR